MGRSGPYSAEEQGDRSLEPLLPLTTFLLVFQTSPSEFVLWYEIMLYGIVYLAFFLASGILIPLTIRLLLGDTDRKWKPVAAGVLALVVLLSLKL